MILLREEFVSGLFSGRPLKTPNHFHGAFDITCQNVIRDFDEAIFKGYLGGNLNYSYNVYKTVPDGTVMINVKHVHVEGQKLVASNDVPGSTGNHYHVVCYAKYKHSRYKVALDPTKLYKCSTIRECIQETYLNLSHLSYFSTIRSFYDQAEGIGIDPGDGKFRKYGFEANDDGSFQTTSERAGYIAYLYIKALNSFSHVIGMKFKYIVIIADMLFNRGEHTTVTKETMRSHLKGITHERRKMLHKVLVYLKKEGR